MYIFTRDSPFPSYSISLLSISTSYSAFDMNEVSVYPGCQFQEKCGTCPEGATCPGGFSSNVIAKIENDYKFIEIAVTDHIRPSPHEGYFLIKHDKELRSLKSWNFVPCSIKSACLGGADNECFETMEGVLCQECKAGFSNGAANRICGRCPSLFLGVAVVVGFVVAILTFCFIMTQLNVSAGFNRRTIHSIVIKIGLNYFASAAVLQEIEYGEMKWPEWLTSAMSTKHGTSGSLPTEYFSVECLLRRTWPELSHADAFFWTVVMYAALPILIPILITLFVLPIFLFLRHRQSDSIRRRLAILQQLVQQGLTDLYVKVHQELANERILTVFRYVPMPREGAWRRCVKFLEDMIPMYIVVSFFLYATVTKQCLKLWQCINIAGERRVLNATSVKCDFKDPVFPRFFAVGVTSSIVWGFGIPAFSFFVLFKNRRRLNETNVRLRYGFLNNGYEMQFWYWETVNYIRKGLILMTANLTVMGSNLIKVWFALVVSMVFSTLHLACRPFDKR